MEVFGDWCVACVVSPTSLHEKAHVGAHVGSVILTQCKVMPHPAPSSRVLTVVYHFGCETLARDEKSNHSTWSIFENGQNFHTESLGSGGLWPAVQEVEGQGMKERLVDGLQNMRESMGRIFGSSLGITTALFMIIWFANALTYYGEVLLTTAVSPPQSREDTASQQLILSTCQKPASIIVHKSIPLALNCMLVRRSTHLQLVLLSEARAIR